MGWQNAPLVESGNPLEQALQAEGITDARADIARSIYHQESGSGRNTKTSNAGARGGMQIIPATFNRMADKGWAIDDPVHNARAGVRYINALYTKAGGDPALTASGYYGGEGAITKARKGIAVSDPRNPKAPNTLQYGQQVAARIPKTQPQPQQSSGSWQDAPLVEVAPEKPINPTDGMSTTQKVLAGVGKGMVDMGRGAGQLMGLVSEEDIEKARELDAPLMNTTSGKVGNFVGQVAGAAPAMLIPGANTYAGASLIGAGLGALQPTVQGESTLTNVAMGAAGGLAGQKLGNVIGGALTKKTANNALRASQNATKDASVKAAQNAGFSVPRSLYNPTFLSNRLENLGGKAGTLQQASANNQEVVNSLTRKALNIPENAALSQGAVETVRKQAYKPYQEIASLNAGAKNTLEQLKQARSDAGAYYTSYNRSANPEHLAKAKEFQEVADVAESVLEDYAKQAGKNNLVADLKIARKTIAKTYTAERAMNKATGDIDARVLKRLFEKDKPLSDGFDEIGRFASAFPKAAQPTQQSAGAGLSALEPMAGAMYGAAGQMATGNPMGLLAAGIPLLRGPARSLALSKMMQKAPKYGGNMLKLGNKVSPMLPYIGTVGGGLLGATN